jgi:polyferredoxin
MYKKISLVKFLRNIVGVALLSGLFFGVLGWFVAGSTGFIYMAIVGAIFCGVGCLAMQISIIFEVRSWQYTSANKEQNDAKAGPWFIENLAEAKPSNP